MILTKEQIEEFEKKVKSRRFKTKYPFRDMMLGEVFPIDPAWNIRLLQQAACMASNRYKKTFRVSTDKNVIVRVK